MDKQWKSVDELKAAYATRTQERYQKMLVDFQQLCDLGKKFFCFLNDDGTLSRLFELDRIRDGNVYYCTPCELDNDESYCSERACECKTDVSTRVIPVTMECRWMLDGGPVLYKHTL